MLWDLALTHEQLENSLLDVELQVCGVFGELGYLIYSEKLTCETAFIIRFATLIFQATDWIMQDLLTSIALP